MHQEFFFGEFVVTIAEPGIIQSLITDVGGPTPEQEAILPEAWAGIHYLMLIVPNSFIEGIPSNLIEEAIIEHELMEDSLQDAIDEIIMSKIDLVRTGGAPDTRLIAVQKVEAFWKEFELEEKRTDGYFNRQYDEDNMVRVLGELATRFRRIEKEKDKDRKRLGIEKLPRIALIVIKDQACLKAAIELLEQEVNLTPDQEADLIAALR